MVYKSQSLYLTWGGRIGNSTGTSDIWQCGIHLADPAGIFVPVQPSAVELQTWYEDIATPMHSAVGLAIAPGAVLRWAKIATLKTDGKYDGDATEFEGFPVPGGANSPSADTGGPQLALVVTLFSGSVLGQANYGRFYLPWSMLPVDQASGRISPSVFTGVLDKVETFLEATNNWIGALSAGPDAKVVNMSKIGLGTTKRVQFVRVGDVKDTQRRRRNRIEEVYEDRPVAL